MTDAEQFRAFMDARKELERDEIDARRNENARLRSALARIANSTLDADMSAMRLQAQAALTD